MDRDEFARAIYPEIAEARDFDGNGSISWDNARKDDEWAINAAYSAADRIMGLVEKAIEEGRFEDYRSTVLDIETRQQ